MEPVREREIAIENENNYENKVENKVIDKSLVIIVCAYLEVIYIFS